jgi:biotin carboxylase
MPKGGVLVLGTGNAQVDLLEFLRHRGLRACGLSNDPNSPGVGLCDKFHEADVRNVDAVTTFASSQQVEAIYSVGSDVAMPTVCRVSELLGLPTLATARAAEICNNKGLLRKVLSAAKIPSPRFAILTSPKDAADFPLPALIKPLDSQGQRGISFVAEAGHVEAAYSQAESFSSAGGAIIEELIEGPEISVSAYVVDGEVKIAIISDRIVWPNLPGGVIKAHEFPSSRLLPATEGSVREVVSKALRALEIRNGPAYLQIKIRDGVPYVIEVTPRLDGCHLWRLVKMAYGVDLLGATLDHLLLGEAPLFQRPHLEDAWSLEFLCQPPETLFSAAAFDSSGAVYSRFYYADGDSVKPINGRMEKCGYLIRKRGR